MRIAVKLNECIELCEISRVIERRVCGANPYSRELVFIPATPIAKAYVLNTSVLRAEAILQEVFDNGYCSITSDSSVRLVDWKDGDE